ncbi:hypothetical protein KFE25_004455 [Diacronema lutheri]|uniref:Uncharacterized protein n=2 Tax=Diacronema lutheri TaxID=2081491 RepID=A0A8J6C2W1_DIALT|nr:hypothetical protein KFE25_004455 [Diacronema lutheri]
MGVLTRGVEFHHVAREVRCKWSMDDDKASLQAAQQLLAEHLAELKGVDGVVSVQRVVCGGCRDFKIITKVNADKFGAFEADGFAGEAAFLDKLGAVSGLSHVETQTYTLEDM